MGLNDTSTDVANRALQHVGASRIADGALFTENSKNAAECAACYDRLREAELRRNVWRFSIRKTALRAIDTTTLAFIPQDWSSTETYLVNAVVAYNGVYYLNTLHKNTNHTPGTDKTWTRYFGPLVADAWDSTQEYFAGELVYVAAAGTYKVYMSMQGSNKDTPGTTPDWDATVTYGVGDVVSYSSTLYVSNVVLNLNNTPGVGTAWSTIPVTLQGLQLGKWQDTGGSLAPINLVYPVGSGPASDLSTRNVYKLPAGFLREAPDDPKEGSTSFLGGPTAPAYKDWLITDDFLVTRDSGVILFRFVANIDDVPKFDSMFFEGLACRIALEVCETLTQSATKLANISKMYDRFMSEARIVNGIETGPTEAPEDDFITCRR